MYTVTILIVHLLVVIRALGNSLLLNAVQGYATENMQMILKETGLWKVVCINLAQNRGKWWAGVKIVLIWVTQDVNSLTNSVAWIYLTYMPQLTFLSIL